MCAQGLALWKNLLSTLNACYNIDENTMHERRKREDFKKEVEELETLYYDLIGEEMPKYFRPPEGKFNEQSMRFASELGYKTIFWSFAYADWDNNSQPSHEYARSKILSNVHNGEIMLLHPTSSTNAEILKDIITELKAQGYSFGTLDDIK